MSQLSSISLSSISLSSARFDAFKRPRVLVAIAGVIVLLIAFWFAWWTPESNKLASVNAQEQTQAAHITTLQAELIQLEHESKFVSQYQSYLAFFSTQVPIQPEEGQLVYDLGRLSNATNVDISDIAANSTAPPAAGETLSTIPVTLTATGSHVAILRFLAGLYTMPRLITLQQISPSPESPPSATYDVLRHDTEPFTITITGTAYFSGAVTTTP